MDSWIHVHSEIVFLEDSCMCVRARVRACVSVRGCVTRKTLLKATTKKQNKKEKTEKKH